MNKLITFINFWSSQILLVGICSVLGSFITLLVIYGVYPIFSKGGEFGSSDLMALSLAAFLGMQIGLVLALPILVFFALPLFSYLDSRNINSGLLWVLVPSVISAIYALLLPLLFPALKSDVHLFAVMFVLAAFVASLLRWGVFVLLKSQLSKHKRRVVISLEGSVG